MEKFIDLLQSQTSSLRDDQKFIFSKKHVQRSEMKEISWENDSKKSEEVKITLKRTRREQIEERKISVPSFVILKMKKILESQTINKFNEKISKIFTYLNEAEPLVGFFDENISMLTPTHGLNPSDSLRVKENLLLQ